ncbi:hypothetical protein DXF88_24010 [Enterobacter roggenkampii]|nr:hypothetical protein DXF88_24010 [Enterobacter roggenkampii]
MLKIAKNSALWLMPILASIIHGAWQEITEKLEWAMVYFANSTSKCDTRLCRLTVLFEYLDRLPESETFPRS